MKIHQGLRVLLLATFCAALMTGCGEGPKSTGVEGTNVAGKQAWYTPLSPATQDELRQRALYQTELSESDETSS